jgi:hypothetical protein
MCLRDVDSVDVNGHDVKCPCYWSDEPFMVYEEDY